MAKRCAICESAEYNGERNAYVCELTGEIVRMNYSDLRKPCEYFMREAHSVGYHIRSLWCKYVLGL